MQIYVRRSFVFSLIAFATRSPENAEKLTTTQQVNALAQNAWKASDQPTMW